RSCSTSGLTSRRAPLSATRATTARPTARPPDPAASAPSFPPRRMPSTDPLSLRKSSTALALRKAQALQAHCSPLRENRPELRFLRRSRPHVHPRQIRPHGLTPTEIEDLATFSA